jgi:hypothetical protein
MTAARLTLKSARVIFGAPSRYPSGVQRARMTLRLIVGSQNTGELRAVLKGSANA